jgi:NAD(P)-dependent dehydrogenase (short-subunit alcohol dehydrogenase family)
MAQLRDGLLEGTSVKLSGSVDTTVREQLEALGASDAQPARALVHDAADTFSQEGLMPALQATWSAIASFAPDAIAARQTAKIILLAPQSSSGTHAEAARAALENLARTLSTEWARYGITTVAIAPGPATTQEELATIIAFLLSGAGDYFSGCRLELGATSI